MPLPEIVTDPAILDGYLSDASNSRGTAEALVRPGSTEEVAAVLRHCQDRGIPVTVTARRTSTTGAPVPEGGWLLSTEKLATLHAPDDADAGLLLGEYQSRVEALGLFFPPDPTSRHECSLGGAVACNASGARTYAYGPTRPWIRAVEAVLATGEVVRATRETPCPWPVPRWEEPHVKTAAGYFPADNLLDLLIGSEGTLGVVTRVWTRLAPLPKQVLALFAFFPTRASLLAFLAEARACRTPAGPEHHVGSGPPGALNPRCIEYFDRRSLDLIRGRVPVTEADSAVLFEIEHEGDPPLEAWIDALQRHGALVDDTIVAEDEQGLAKLHAIRHALPAEVNEIIARTGVRKVGTDFAVPDAALPEMLDRYDDTGMPAVCFGHLGDNHLHLNFLPRSQAEWAEAKERYMALARRAVELGGTVSAEHGIGRMKRAHLAMMVGEPQIAAWRALRRQADPNAILGRGVMV